MANPFLKFAPAQGQADNPFQQFAPRAQPKTFDRDEDEALYRDLLAKEQQRRTQPSVPRSGYEYAPTAEEEAIKQVEEQRGREAEEAQFQKSRTPLERVKSTAAFVPSAVVRMVTRGEYGLGDVVESASPGRGKVLARKEAEFARANEWGLQKLNDVGTFTAGIPVLSTMGVPVRGIAATGAAIANKPLPQKFVKRALTRNERLADIDAFQGAGVRPFGPALTESGTAGVVKQLSDAPIVGASVRNRLEAALGETRDAGERIASGYGSARSYRDVGNVAGQGLERFKDTRVDRITGQTPDIELAGIVRAPARQTSLKTKGDALYERAWRDIPEDMAQGRSKTGQNRFLGGFSNTRALLQELAERNQSMYAKTRGGIDVDQRLSYPVRGGVVGQIVEDIIDGRWRGNLQSMRDVRSSFRRLASGIADTERNTLTLSDMKRIQSAMTTDMIDLLGRNADWYAANGQAATAAKVRQAIHKFRRADQFTRASAQRLEAIERLYGVQSAEQLGLSIFKDAMGGRKGGNFQRLAALRRSLKDDEWGDVSAGIIREMGRPIASARGAAEDLGFSVQSFTTNWNSMSKEGRNMLFKNAHTKELGTALDRFARVADRMANFEAMANTSRSATNALGIGGLLSIIAAGQQALMGSFEGAAAAGSAAGGMYAFGKFMTSPAYVRWLTRAAELSGNPGKLRALRVHARQLGRLAEREPDPQIQNLMQAIVSRLGDVATHQ